MTATSHKLDTVKIMQHNIDSVRFERGICLDSKSYHHENLKNTLIEKGIEIISLEGDANLSLRKVASACGVSHAAPYAHFKNKNDLINAMQEHVASELSKTLMHVIETCSEKEEILTYLGKAYVIFFMDNPHYFSFLFSRTEVMVDFSYNADPANNYRPYEIFRQTAIQALNPTGLSHEKMNDLIITMFALVHGLASIATMKNTTYNEKWEDKIETLLTLFSIGRNE